MNISLVRFNKTNQLNTKLNVPFSRGLQSKMQDVFHQTGSQIRIRTFLENESLGLSEAEIAEKMFPKTFADKENTQDKQIVLDFMQTLKKRINDLENFIGSIY